MRRPLGCECRERRAQRKADHLLLGTDSWLEAPLGGETDERGEALVDQRGRTRLDTIARFTIGAPMSPDVSQKADIYPRGFLAGAPSTCISSSRTSSTP